MPSSFSVCFLIVRKKNAGKKITACRTPGVFFSFLGKKAPGVF
jgi:hypothetical protein